jgi:hypothetical protein
MGRFKKALRILNALNADSRLTAELMAQAPTAWWELVARKAGTAVRSPETTALILEMAREREARTATTRWA